MTEAAVAPTIDPMAEASPEKAVRAARKALQAGDWAGAGARYAEAAEALAERRRMEEAVRCWFRAARCAEREQALDRAEERWHEAAGLARGHNLDALLDAALGELGLLARRRGRVVEAASFHHEALERARERLAAEGGEFERGDPSDVAAVANHTGNLGLLAAARGDHDEARERLREALTAHVARGDPAGAATAVNALGEVERAGGHDREAREAFEQALELWGEAEDEAGRSLALSNLGNLERAAGRLEAAAAHFREALALAERAGDELGAARAHTNLGNVAAARGARAEAREHYERSLEVHQRVGFAQGLAADRVNLANLAAEEGRLAEAREAYAEARAAFRDARQAAEAVDVACLVGQLDARLGRLDAAEEAFSEAAEEARTHGFEEARARAEAGLAGAAYARGDVGRAVDGFLEGARFFAARQRPRDEATCRVTAADALLAAGRDEEAARAADEALSALEGLPAEGHRAEAEAMRARVAFVRAPDEPRRRELLAAAERLEAHGRPVEALAHRLVATDARASGLAGGAVEGGADEAAEARRAAASMGLRPMAVDAESLELLAARPPAEAAARLETLRAEAAELGLAILSLRLRRRRVRALEASGADDEAAAELERAREEARRTGARAELARLDGGESPQSPVRSR